MIEIEKVYFRKGDEPEAEVVLLDRPLPQDGDFVYPSDSWPLKPPVQCARIRALIAECQGFVDMTISREHIVSNESTWDQYKFFRGVVRDVMNYTRYSYRYKQTLDIKHVVIVPEMQLGTLNLHVHVNYCFASGDFIEEKIKFIKSILLSKHKMRVNGKLRMVNQWGLHPVGISAQVIEKPVNRTSYLLKSHSKTSQHITVYARCAGDGTFATTEIKEERSDVLLSLSDRCAGDGTSHPMATLSFE